MAITGLALAWALLAPAGMRPVGPGVYRPLFPASADLRAREIPVPAFRLDRRPVTNAEFAAFVAANPRWRRDRAPRLLADAGYLQAWAEPASPGPGVRPDAPVVRVSYFAAAAYCEARGARLPTEAEWELAAAAGRDGPDGRREPGFTQRILDWYARPNGEIGGVAEHEPNFWGLYDLHGLIWEWIGDFNASMVASDRDTQARFCGAGAAGSEARDDYAAFMRSAFRSALTGNTTTANLGFRCARSGGGKTGSGKGLAR